LAKVRDAEVVTTSELAEMAGVSRSTLYRLLAEHDRSGD
jgi:DNA-binding MurR/RpiR family transcriptional regulator